MSSQRKIDSARANGAKSRGPVTEEGKKKSSMNALKHGLNAKTVVLPNEDDDEYHDYLESYIDDFQPAGAAEMDHVVEMVNAKWQQRRIAQIQSDLYDDAILRSKEDLEDKYDEYSEVQEHTAAFEKLADNGLLDKLRRTEAHHQRAYTRALKDLLHLQRLRKAESHKALPTNEKITERTQPSAPATPDPTPREPQTTPAEVPILDSGFGIRDSHSAIRDSPSATGIRDSCPRNSSAPSAPATIKS